MTPHTPERELALREAIAHFRETVGNLYGACAEELESLDALLNEAPAAPTMPTDAMCAQCGYVDEPRGFKHKPGCHMAAPASTPAEPLSAEREIRIRFAEAELVLMRLQPYLGNKDLQLAHEFMLLTRDLLATVTRLRQELRERETAIGRLDIALQAAWTRYSRDRGEPEPTPAFPVEIVFTMPQWDVVLRALGRATSKPGGSHE